MEIRGLSNPLATLLGQRKAVEPSQDPLAALPAASTDSSAAAGSLLDEILADYDLHRITPQKFSELIDRLKSVDILSARDHQQLNQLRQALDSAGLDADQSLDLLSFIRSKLDESRQSLAAAQANDDPSQLSALEATVKLAQDQSDWLNKLDAAKRDRPLGGLDAKV
ncbi:MAG: hypothetical protein JNM18_19140 [Planctomycetaceae bacterium]|nr:hypothetical protein [Planctomycetaceae bacterium]